MKRTGDLSGGHRVAKTLPSSQQEAWNLLAVLRNRWVLRKGGPMANNTEQVKEEEDRPVAKCSVGCNQLKGRESEESEGWIYWGCCETPNAHADFVLVL